jgi:2-hydroxychromene-2-carboxylate isomerase
MTEPIEFFFDVVSPFGWFSAERVGGLPPVLQTPVCTRT